MQSKSKMRVRLVISIAAVLAFASVLGFVSTTGLFAQDRERFPEGFDAVQIAPRSHEVVFENALIRVLQVNFPAEGSAEPMHHHRWPSLFLRYDSGGKTAHMRYHTPNGKVIDIPSKVQPLHPGKWVTEWMEPESMHAIEVVEAAAPGPSSPPGELRVEIKVPLK